MSIEHMGNSLPCEGLSTLSKDSAWNDFYKDCEHNFEWARGEKTWQSAPVLSVKRNIQSGQKEYRVFAKFLVFKKLPKGWPEAKVRGPYDVSKAINSTKLLY